MQEVDQICSFEIIINFQSSAHNAQHCSPGNHRSALCALYAGIKVSSRISTLDVFHHKHRHKNYLHLWYLNILSLYY